MSANTALITDAAKLASRQVLSDYSSGVFAHTTGDWTRHNVVRVYNQPFIDGLSDAVSVATLRILGTLGNSDQAVIIPVNPTGSDVLLTSAPIITVQPQDTTVGIGGTARFVVGAISDTPMSFQWLKGGAVLTGQTASQLVLPSLVFANAGAYAVTVSNQYGSVTSKSATLVVGSVAGGNSGGGGFDILDIIFFPF